MDKDEQIEVAESLPAYKDVSTNGGLRESFVMDD
jgi:hypothetical protein